MIFDIFAALLMALPSSIDAKTTLGISGIREDTGGSRVDGFIRLKASDRAVPLQNHVILILDLSLSMSRAIKGLHESIKQILNRMTPHRDKCTIIGFGGETRVYSSFTGVEILKGDFDSLIMNRVSTLTGTTDFKAGLDRAILVVDEMASMYADGRESIGNEIMEWNAHNHVAIFMTDGKNYGNVPWMSVENLASRSITLHTVALKTGSGDINSKSVRRMLLKMAKEGGGGFNFSKTIDEFHKKVNTLLDLSLDAVTKPAKLRIFPAEGVEIVNSTILGHAEQRSEEVEPEFVFPALLATERKILVFHAKITKAHSKNTRAPLFKFEMTPDYLGDSDVASVAVPVMPTRNFLELIGKGQNAEFRVHMLLKEVEEKINDALESAVKNENIEMFKDTVQISLNQALKRVETNFAKHPKRDTLTDTITGLKKMIDKEKDIVDPKEFFSTIYALMRTTR